MKTRLKSAGLLISVLIAILSWAPAIRAQGSPTILTTSLPFGTVGTSYSQALTASGGTTPYTWTLKSGSLPAGLALASTGVISGTPTTTGTPNFTVTVTDSASRNDSQALSIMIRPATLVITTSSLASGFAGSVYSQSLAASGGTKPYSWSITQGTLPAGLTLSSNNGTISGTPSTAGTFNFTVRVADNGSQTASTALSITINPALAISTTSPLAEATVGVSYSQTLIATGGVAPYAWSVTSGSLPAGLTLSAPGTISGTPTSSGTSNFSVQVTDNGSRSASRTFALKVNPTSLSVTTTSLPRGMVGSAYSQSLAASGGTTPYTWSITQGTLPAGLTLSSNNGTISGTPSTAGTSNFTVRAADSGSQTASTALSITIDAALSITTTSPLAEATVGVSYSQTLIATGGVAPYAWSVTSGSLPAGLTLSAPGTISGTPTSSGTSNFSVQVTDNGSRSASRTFALKVNPTSLSVTTTSLPRGMVGSAYSQSLAASGGTTPYTWSITQGTLPAGLTLSSGGTISGTPSTAGTSIFTVRAADNGSQTASTALSIAIDAAPVITPPPPSAPPPSAPPPSAPPTIDSTSPLGNGAVGVVYLAAVSASGGTPPYSWSITAGQLPPGLSLSANGILAGTPATGGSYSFTVQALDDAGRTATKVFAITIQSGVTITTSSPLPAAVVGSRYSQQIESSFSGSLTWSVSSGNLPAGLTLSSSGLLAGTPSASGTFEFEIQAAGGTPTQNITRPFRLDVVRGLTITTPGALPDGKVGTGYSVALGAAGGVPPYTWTQTAGSLPDGLSLSSAGAITGTPVRAALFTISARVSDSAGGQAAGSFTISIVPDTIGALALRGVGETMSPTQQFPVGLSLSAPYPAVLTGVVTLTFASNAVIPSDDPVVQFSTGSRSVNFTIPANSTTAVFPAPVMLSTGTVLGTIVLTANIDNGPAGIPVGSITIRPTVPQISNVTAVRTAGGLRIQITGYSPERRVSSVEFGFDVTTPGGTQRVNLSRNVETEFVNWYTSAASIAFGSTFLFDQSFTVQGDTTMIKSVTVTLTNGQGVATSNAVPIGSN